MSFPSDLEIARAATAEAAARDRVGDGYRRAPARAVRLEPRQDPPGGDRGAERSSEGEVRRRHGDHADTARRGQDHDDRRPRAGDEAHREAFGDRLAPTVDGPDVRHQGRCGRRRLQPGHPDGPAQPAPDRRLPRRHRRPQPAVGDARQPPPSGQRARPRSLQHHLAASARRQRPGAAQHRHRVGRQGRRHRPSDRVRHHRRLRGDGDPRPGDVARGPAGADGPDRRRLHEDGGRRSPPSSCTAPGRWR